MKFIAVLPTNLKKITMYIYNALALNKFLRNSEYPKDHLSSHFFSSVVVFVSPAKHIAVHRENFVWRLSVRPSVRVSGR